jgi:mRNA interferase RelE/StbE
MQYNIVLAETAQRFLNKCDKDLKERIIKKIILLKENPQLGKPLVGRLSGWWSLRIGDYRVIYQVKNNELIIVVIRIGHRKNVYD